MWQVEISSYSEVNRQLLTAVIAVNRQLLTAVIAVNVSNQQNCSPFYIDRFLSGRSEEYYHYNYHNHPYSNYNTVACLVYLMDLVCEYVVSW